MNWKVGSRGGRRAVPARAETGPHKTIAYQKTRPVVKTRVYSNIDRLQSQVGQRPDGADGPTLGRCGKISKPCHSERSEESVFVCFQGDECRYFASLSMTDGTGAE